MAAADQMLGHQLRRLHVVRADQVDIVEIAGAGSEHQRHPRLRRPLAQLAAAVDGPGEVTAALAGEVEPKAGGRRRGGGRRSHKEGKDAKDRLAQEPESASEPASATPRPADEKAAAVVAEADPAKARRGGGRPRRVESEPDSPVGDTVAVVLAEPGAPEVAKAPAAKRVTRAPRGGKPKAVSE